MSFFGNAMKNVVAARERQAQRYVSRVLDNMGKENVNWVQGIRQDSSKGL